MGCTTLPLSFTRCQRGQRSSGAQRHFVAQTECALQMSCRASRLCGRHLRWPPAGAQTAFVGPLFGSLRPVCSASRAFCDANLAATRMIQPTCPNPLPADLFELCSAFFRGINVRRFMPRRMISLYRWIALRWTTFSGDQLVRGRGGFVSVL